MRGVDQTGGPKGHSLGGLHVFKDRCVIPFVSFKLKNKVYGSLEGSSWICVHENHTEKKLP